MLEKSKSGKQNSTRMVSTIEHMQVPNWKRTDVRSRHATPTKMFYKNRSEFSIHMPFRKPGHELESYLISGGCQREWLWYRMSFHIRERGKSYCLIRYSYKTERSQFFMMSIIPWDIVRGNLLESQVTPRIRYS